MGFFDSLTGGSSSSSKQGYWALPKTGKNVMNDIWLGARDYASPYKTVNGQRVESAENINRFTPLGETADETRAFDMIRQGFTPNEETLGNDMSMMMNPFDDYVIDDINKEALGDYSLIKQAVSDAGQFGSNRQVLGASQVEDTRLSNVGKFKQDQYNKALDHALRTLPALRMSDATGLLGIGEFQRDLDWRTKQAPIAGLEALYGMASGSGLSGAVSGSAKTSSSSSGGFLSGLSNIASGLSAAGSFFRGGEPAGGGGSTGGTGSDIASWANMAAMAANFFSDQRLKENIRAVGEKNGHRIYEFNYIGEPQRYRGVMAQDVLETHPEAVGEAGGYLTVNYDLIGMKMEAV